MKQNDELKDLVAAGVMLLALVIIGAVIIAIMVSNGGV